MARAEDEFVATALDAANDVLVDPLTIQGGAKQNLASGPPGRYTLPHEPTSDDNRDNFQNRGTQEQTKARY